MSEFNPNVDPRLIDSIKTASEGYPFQVVLKSGYREGDPRFHGKKMAIDVQLLDPETGRAIPNYQSPENFRTYEQFAQKVREVQQDKYPELDKAMRWGGYFSGKKNYGAVDLMHFDAGGEDMIARYGSNGMNGGDWATGLNGAQRKLIPGAESVGMNAQRPASDLIADAEKGFADNKAPSTYDTIKSEVAANIPKSQLSNLLAAYQSGKMPPEAMKAFEKDVNSGFIALPVGVKVGGSMPTTNGTQPHELPQSAIDAYNAGAKNPYDKGAMPDDARKALDRDLHEGIISLPSGAVLNPHYMGIVEKAKEAVTGDLRSTDATKNSPDYPSMPELNSIDWKGFKSSLGTMTGGPDEIVKVIKANYPGVSVNQDEHGNYLLTSSIDGKQYAIKPGMTLGDAIRGATVAGTFTPAMKATTIVGGALANAGTEAALQAAHAGAGGSFDPSAIATAGVIGGAIPAAARTIEAVAPALKGAIGRVIGREAKAGVAPEARAGAGAVDPAAATVAPAPTVAPPAPVAGASQGAGFAEDAAKYEAGQQPILRETAKGTVEIPDNEHATLFDVGRRLAHGETVSTKELKEVYKTFKGYVTHDAQDEFSQFKSPEDVKSLATDYYHSAVEGAKPDKVIHAGDTLESDAARAAWLQKNRGSNVKLDTTADPVEAKIKPVTEGAQTPMDAAPPSSVPTPNLPEVSGYQSPYAAAKAEAPRATAAAPSVGMTPDEIAIAAKRAADGGLGANRALETLAAEARPNAKTVDAAKALGFEDYLQVDHVTTSQSTRQLHQVLKSIPGSMLKQAEGIKLGQVAEGANSIIKKLGGTEDLSTLNKNVGEHLEAARSALKNAAKKLYDEVDAAIPKETPISVSNFKAYIDQRIKELGGEVGLEPGEKRAIAQLSIGAGDKPTYGALDSLRKQINAVKFGQTGGFADTSDYIREGLLKALRKDQAAAAKAAGVGDKWELAQATAAQKLSLQQDITTLFGKTLDKAFTNKLVTAVNAIEKGDASQIAKLISLIPKDMRQDVVASGLHTAFGKSAARNSISFGEFSKWYEHLLKNKQAYHAIMSNLPPEARKQLSNLYRVSKGISLSTREAITTGRLTTGMEVIKERMAQADNLLSTIYGIAKRSAVGSLMEAVTTPLGLPGAGIAAAVASALTKGKTPALQAADALLASPEFEQAVRMAATGQTKAAASRLAYSKPFVRFARSVGNPREMTNREKFILQALEQKNND
jgi:hypothetical protein